MVNKMTYKISPISVTFKYLHPPRIQVVLRGSTLCTWKTVSTLQYLQIIITCRVEMKNEKDKS
jgi:hypothetical protein